MLSYAGDRRLRNHTIGRLASRKHPPINRKLSWKPAAMASMSICCRITRSAAWSAAVQMVEYLVREGRYVGEENVENAAESHKTEGSATKAQCHFPVP